MIFSRRSMSNRFLSNSYISRMILSPRSIILASVLICNISSQTKIYRCVGIYAIFSSSPPTFLTYFTLIWVTNGSIVVINLSMPSISFSTYHSFTYRILSLTSLKSLFLIIHLNAIIKTLIDERTCTNNPERRE